MRIGIDIRALMEGKITGVQVYILNLLEALFKIDKKNEYLLFGNSFSTSPVRWTSSPSLGEGRGWGFPLQEMERAGRGRIKIRFFNYPNKLFIPAQKYLGLPKVDKLLGGVDLFFSPHWRIAALSPNVSLVVTFHDLSFEIVPEFFTLKQRLWHKFMDYRGAAQRANRVIAVSESTKRDLIDIYKVPESKIRVVYPGVRPLSNSPLARGEGVNSDYFLYFGTFEPRKNVESVLGAYEIYFQKSKIKRPLVLAGSSGWKSKLKIPEAIKSQISIFRDVDEKQKWKLCQNAFAFLFLSYYEGFGFPILEAASAGIPVISSFASSLQEIGRDFALMVNPFRPAQVVEAMLALENEPEFYDRLQEEGLAAAQKFSWEKTAKKTLELFQEMIK